MNLHELTRDQLIALVRQRGEALEAAETEADLRAKLATRVHTNDRMHLERDLGIAADRAARLRKEALAKGGRA